jgi:hypothetical protein
MTLPSKGPVPQPALSWLTAQGRQDLAQYLAKLDALVSALALEDVGNLVNAANDAAAAKAGVVIGQLYRNGSVVQIRVT